MASSVSILVRFGEQLGEPGADAVAEGLGGGVGRIDGGFQFGDQGAFGHVDLGELLTEAVGPPLAALVLGGGAGGEGVAASMAARPGPNTRSVKNRVRASIMRSSPTLTVRWLG